MKSAKKKSHHKQTSKPTLFGAFLTKIKAFFTDTWPIIFISLIVTLLCFLNFDSGTFLSGWDNLHPEFNPSLYLKRTLFSVWQEYQGTGLLGGMAHSADLPRVIFIYLLDLLDLPTNLIRYLTTFLTLYLGPISTYLLFSKILKSTQHSQKTIQISSFLGALFYLLNLSTLQTFFIPFETFTWFYGFFPLIIFYLITYFEKPKLSNFLRLFLVSFLSGTAFYVQTMFVVAVLCLTPLLIENISKNKHFFKNTSQSLASFLSFTIPNLYWLLPVVFFVFTNGFVTTQNHINSISSIETYYRNLEFSGLGSFLTFKSYLFKYLDLGLNNKYELLLTPWLNHLNSLLPTLIGYIFVLLTLLGIYYSIKSNIKFHKSFLAITLICAFFLMGGGLLINNTLPLIGELFRSPFTKFSLPLALSFSFFFSIGIIFLLDIFSFLDSRLTYNLTLFTTCLLLFVHMSPAFSGNFINKNMRVAIPNEYFELFAYLDSKPADLRIANFPQHTHWGWNYYSWGHRGSGFTWYGIKQPLLDRAFDVWEKTSEEYYQEISTALYSEDLKQFSAVIDKYNVAYLLLDMSIIAPDTKASLGTNYLDRILANTDQYKLEKTFGQNLYLYKNNKHKTKDYLSVITNNYKDESKLLDFTERPNQNWYERAGFLNSSLNINSASSSSLLIPSLSQSEELLPYQVEYRKGEGSVSLRFTPITPYLFVDNKQIDLNSSQYTITAPLNTPTDSIIMNLNNEYLSFDLPSETPTTSFIYLTQVYLPTQKAFPVALYQGVPTENYPIINSLQNNKPKQCYTNKDNRKIEMLTNPRSITLLGTDVVACLSANLPPVNQDQLLALSFTYFSPTLSTANVNVTNENFGTNNTAQPFEASKTPKRAQIFIKPSPDNKQINLLLEAEETKSIQEITYKDVYLSSHNTLYEINLKLPEIKEKIVNLPDNSNTKIQLSLPITKTIYNITQTPQSNSLFPENRNCDRFNSGQTVKINKEDRILYQSQNAIQCDYLNLRHLPHNLNYIFGFEATNTKGLPLVTCLENHATRRCDIYERLKNLDGQQYILQTIKNPNEQNGYTLHLFNQSFGKKIGENHLKSITINPFPLNFLKNITVKQGQNRFSQGTINSSSHPYEFLYKLEVNSQGSSEINLLQTKSPYWKALQITPEDYSKPPLLLAIKYFALYPQAYKFTAMETKDWYNTWAIPSGGNHILLIYLPQYLQFLGLIFIILVLLFTLPILLYQKLKN